jgi:hypothetical protein
LPRAGLALLGLLELAGAVGLFLKRTRVAAATGLASILFGAIATHLASGMEVFTVAMPVALLVLLGAALAVDPSLRFETVEVANHSKLRRAATFGLSLLLAAQFLLAGGMKASGAAEMMANMEKLHFGAVFVHLLGAPRAGRCRGLDGRRLAHEGRARPAERRRRGTPGRRASRPKAFSPWAWWRCCGSWCCSTAG